MATPPEALRFDARTQSWKLNTGFDASWMMWHLETEEAGRTLAPEDWRGETDALGSQSAQNHGDMPQARLRDAGGTLRAQGFLTGDLHWCCADQARRRSGWTVWRLTASWCFMCRQSLWNPGGAISNNPPKPNRKPGSIRRMSPPTAFLQRAR